MDMALKDAIERAALINAVQHKGRASPKAVLGRLLAENPAYRSNAEQIEPEVWAIVARINKLKAGEQRDLLKEIEPKFLEKKEKVVEKKELPDLKGAKEGKVVMRFEPSPSGYMHIGHAYVLGLNHLLAQKYKGKLYLRISDTNTDNIFPPAYEALVDDGNWLTDGNIIPLTQSDRMKIYYKYAEKIISKGFAYVCACNPEKWKSLMIKCEECPCRNLSPDKHIKRWKKMLENYKEGEAVVRIKTDMQHKNPALRDWPALRINTEKHARQGNKYRVWPLMNFAVAIDDYDTGVTHVVHGKEHMDNAKRRKFLYDHLGWKMQKISFLGRINFIGLPMSKTKTKEAIKEGVYSGWDDPRIPIIKNLRRRGYLPEALLRFSREIGISENDKTMQGEDYFKMLDSFNREIIDPIALRYSFVPEPVKISVLNQPDILEVSVPVSPYFKNRKKIEVRKDIWIAKADLNEYKGKEIRLKGLFNIKLKKKAEFTSLKNKNIQKIQWVSAGAVKAEVLMPDGSVVNGLAEPTIKKLKAGETIQFERFGFVRLDKKPSKFCFMHK